MTKLREKPFALVGVHIGGLNARQLKDVMEKQQLPWRSFVDPGGAGSGPIAKRWNLSSTPTLYLLDARGVIRNKWAGAPGEKVIEAAVERLMEGK